MIWITPRSFGYNNSNRKTLYVVHNNINVKKYYIEYGFCEQVWRIRRKLAAWYGFWSWTWNYNLFLAVSTQNGTYIALKRTTRQIQRAYSRPNTTSVMRKLFRVQHQNRSTLHIIFEIEEYSISKLIAAFVCNIRIHDITTDCCLEENKRRFLHQNM